MIHLHKKWRNLFADSLMDVSLGNKNNVIVLTTHNTFSSNDFRKIVREYKSKALCFLIADEVHGLGSEKRRKGLIPDYDFRLGLSATPRRWFDVIGTKALYEYFNGEIYQYSLSEAINTVNPSTGKTYLTPFRYLPRFAYLSVEEMELYSYKTKRIGKLTGWASKHDEIERYLELVIFARANIIKNAQNKYQILNMILDEINLPMKWTIIYCSPKQIDPVMNLINKRRYITHRFTMEEGTDPKQQYGGLSERDFLLQSFGEGKYQVLVAMKCLDEGVDIPPARTAILMSSSGNPREYIQRIGRVVRRYPGKTESTIYDIVVLPSLTDILPELKDLERRIVVNELKRYEAIAKIAINSVEALSIISEISERVLER